jgi:subtilisin family serine protease
VTFGALLLLLLAEVAGAQPPKTDQGKLSSELHRLVVAAERGERLGRAHSAWMDEASQRVSAVLVLAEGATRSDVEASVRAAGGAVEAASGGLVKVSLPPRSLREVSLLPSVVRMRTPFRPSPKVSSEGADTIHAPAYRDRKGVDGTGVGVGILDVGFQHASTLLGTELPEDLLATDFVLERLASYDDPHGTACAEIIHDIAPGATLVLAGFEDEVTWGQAVDELVNSGVRIISHSVGFDNLFPPDGNHFFARKVDEAASRGVLVVTAAGNEADRYYQGPWRDGNANDYLEFTSEVELLPIFVSGGTSLVLRWDDPYGSSNHDFDLFVVTDAFAENADLSPLNPAILAASVDLQSGSQDPLEKVDFSAEGIVYVVIRHDRASPLRNSQRFFLWSSAGIDAAFGTASGTLTLPGDAREGVSVGAVQFDSLELEGFSSRGPTADDRVKPDLVGPDGVTTASYDGSPFFGSSAATPHVAGAAALILHANPNMSLSSLRRALEEAVNSLGRRGKSNETGFGLVDLDRAR